MSREKAYADSIEKVCHYIYAHLDDDLSVELLSRVAGFSKFHFHRQFSEFTGMGVFKMIQMLRLKRAAYQLVFHRELRIIAIALQAGFESPEAFARAFKQAFGQTPSQFRKQPAWIDWNEKYQAPIRKQAAIMQVETIDFPETRVAVLEHLGPPGLVNDTVGQFIVWRKASGLSPIQSSQTFGIAYHDPQKADPETYRFDICGTVGQDVPANAQGVITKLIPGGRCARLRHQGSYDRFGVSLQYLYAQWLPQSGESLRDFPLFFQYVNLFPEVPEHELITDIHLPLRDRP